MVNLIVKWGDDFDKEYVIPDGKTNNIDWHRYSVGNFVVVKAKGWEGDDKKDEVVLTNLKGRLSVNRPELYNDWTLVMFCIPENAKSIAHRLSKYLDINSVEDVVNEIEDATAFHVKTSAPDVDTGFTPVKNMKRKLKHMTGGELVEQIPLFSHVVQQDEIIKKKVKKIRKLKIEMSELILDVYMASQVRANEIENLTKRIK